jgi:maleylacetate reductase
MLPHTIGFNAVSVPDLLAPVATLFGGSAGVALHGFARSIGAPMSLRELGFERGAISKAAALATKTPYPNPRAIDEASMAALLEQAFHGEQPEA